MNTLHAPGFPEAEVRDRAARGAAAVFPPTNRYGTAVFGEDPDDRYGGDALDAMRLVPPVFMPHRLARLIELGREPLFSDVSLECRFGGMRSPVPVYVSALGSTRVAADGVDLARQAGRIGLPMVIGENVAPMNGFRPERDAQHKTLSARIQAYTEELPDGVGGVCVQQSTEDADTEVWNFLYSDPVVEPLLSSGRLAFELKTGQGAKPGLGGLTLVDDATAERLGGRFAVESLGEDGPLLRCASPGTFTEEILRQQVHLIRNNYPRAHCWVKLPPARDVAEAAEVAWRAGAAAVTVDGAEGGTGWAPSGFLRHVGLPLAQVLRRIGTPAGDLLASGRVWEGTRTAKLLASGAAAAGLGRAALLAVSEDPEAGLCRLIDALALELRMLTSAVGHYDVTRLSSDDLWSPHD
ncbi:glutamate synthase-like protein [Stackebrandtia albiflava]|uniref:Glutamate synthase-like protein n=1 Tax=Stackebrandtia albiflava TaxID=406432 RepID=A0A562VBV1_9ACTN|nr:glutamate synthase-related protein [Stackebrandtia albiflava]TWJ15364.1 glutamate synthase-like protein [Stackebrandtia albiflava]